jgi:hypothetical protein
MSDTADRQLQEFQHIKYRPALQNAAGKSDTLEERQK